MSRLHIAVVVNDLETVTPSQTTWGLAKEMVRRGHHVFFLPAFQLGVDRDGDVRAQCVPLPGEHSKLVDTESMSRKVSEFDLVLIRTNPGRESRAGVTDMMLMLLARAHREGVNVVNTPLGLWRASNKLYVAELAPDLRPETVVTHQEDEARSFIVSIGAPCVVKPIRGTRGRDVFFINGPGDPNLLQILDVIARQGPVMVQRYVPEAIDGDIRVVLMDGAPLTVRGHVCAVRRRPSGSDFRSNVHVGGKPEPANLSPAQLDVAHRVASKLKKDGIAIAGMDLIGGRVVEVNVFSTGGYGDAELFCGVNFTGATIDWLESCCGAFLSSLHPSE